MPQQIQQGIQAGLLAACIAASLTTPAVAADLSDAKKAAATVTIPTGTTGSGSSMLRRGLLFSVGQGSQPSGGLASSLQALGYSGVSVNEDKQDSALSLGYRHPITRRWSADMQYLQQGKTTPAVQATLPLGKTNAQAAQDTAEAMPKRGQGISALALYHHPLSSKLTLQAGLGAFVWQSERTATVGSSTYTSKDEGVSPMLQLGLSYPISHRTRLEGHWQHTFMSDEGVDRVGLGVAVGF